MTTPLLVLTGMTHRDRPMPPLEVFPGEAVALVGRPGTGKSLILRTAAGLRPPGSARRACSVRVAYVFAEGGLLGTLSVRDNLLLPLAYAGRADAEADVDTVVRLWGLEGIADSLPLGLSPTAQRLVQFARVEATGAALAVVEENPQGTETSERVRSWWRRHLARDGGIVVAVSALSTAERLKARPVWVEDTEGGAVSGARTEVQE